MGHGTLLPHIGAVLLDVTYAVLTDTIFVHTKEMLRAQVHSMQAKIEVADLVRLPLRNISRNLTQ